MIIGLKQSIANCQNNHETNRYRGSIVLLPFEGNGLKWLIIFRKRSYNEIKTALPKLQVINKLKILKMLKLYNHDGK